MVIESGFESLQSIEVVHRFYEEFIVEEPLHIILEFESVLELESSFGSFFGYSGERMSEAYESSTQCEIARCEIGWLVHGNKYKK